MASFKLRDIHGNPINFQINSDDHKKTDDALARTKMTDEEEKEMQILIENNMTDDDKSIKVPSQNITIQNIKKKFTDDFLRSIDDIYKRIMANTETSANDLGHLWQQIIDIIRATGAYKWNNEWDDYRRGKNYYYASNTLYFLFLANLYCHLFEYIEKYEWIESFLEGFELGTPPITGIFYIDTKLHEELFSRCHRLKIPIKQDYIISDGILSNTTIKTTIKSIREKPLECPFGAGCYRQDNKLHIAFFNHPTGMMKASRKLNRVHPYTRPTSKRGGKRPKKTRKRRTKRHTKRIKRKTIKRK